jgi:hypothetical protein
MPIKPTQEGQARRMHHGEADHAEGYTTKPSRARKREQKKNKKKSD